MWFFSYDLVESMMKEAAFYTRLSNAIKRFHIITQQLNYMTE